MATLSITAPRTEARVERETATSLALHVPGWVGDGADHLFVVPEQSGRTYPWVRVDEPPAGGPGVAFVRFDASLAPHPRAGDYPVRVTAWRGSQQASVVVRFVVPRHPCLQVTPRPSVTFDPLTGTATVKLALWSCGNVDLDVSWSAHVRGRKVTVDPAQITVFADGRHVDTTLTIDVPHGTVDVEHELDLKALSEAGVEPVLPSRAAPPPPPRVPRRPVRRGPVGGVILAAAVAGGAVLTVSRLSATDGPPRSGPADTEAAPVTDPPPSDGGTAASGPETTAGPPPTDPVGSTEPTAPSTTGQAGTIDLVPIVGGAAPQGTCPASGTDCFAFSVQNQGDSPAPATEATVGPAGEPLLLTVEVPPLAAGERWDVAVPMTCPSRCEARVTVDAGDVVPESDEDNNVYAPPVVE